MMLERAQEVRTCARHGLFAGTVALVALFTVPRADASRSLAPYLKVPPRVVPGRAVTITAENMSPQDLSWVRIQPASCGARYGCEPAFARIVQKRTIPLGVILSIRWPAGYDECNGSPQGSGGFCPGVAHTWTMNEKADVFVGSYVFDESACATTAVTPGLRGPSQPAPPGGLLVGGTARLPCS